MLKGESCQIKEVRAWRRQGAKEYVAGPTYNRTLSFKYSTESRGVLLKYPSLDLGF